MQHSASGVKPSEQGSIEDSIDPSIEHLIKLQKPKRLCRFAVGTVVGPRQSRRRGGAHKAIAADMSLPVCTLASSLRVVFVNDEASLIEFDKWVSAGPSLVGLDAEWASNIGCSILQVSCLIERSIKCLIGCCARWQGGTWSTSSQSRTSALHAPQRWHSSSRAPTYGCMHTCMVMHLHMHACADHKARLLLAQ